MSNTIIGNNLIAVITGGVFVLVPLAETVEETVEETVAVIGELQTFDEILVENAPHILDIFSVEGTYQPGVLNREIQVIVRYVTDDGQVSPVVRHRGPIANIKVANNSVTGISAEEFKQGQIINIPPRKGADARDFSLARIIKQDAGMMTIEVH